MSKEIKTYAMAIARLKSDVRGCYPEIVERVQCTRPTVCSAFRKSSPEMLTATERRVIEAAMAIVSERKAQEAEWERKVVETVSRYE